MSGSTFKVSTEWALHGKASDSEGYRVLSCSTGSLSKTNFADALGRFTIGALKMLPQVSLSYLQPATHHPGSSYLALAINWFANDGQRYADGVLALDNLGRETAFTSYFCVPYREFAERAVTYLDMYRAFSAITLPAQDAPPKQVEIATPAPRTPVIDDFAMRVASLLLDAKPVCVLGADDTTMNARLEFIDSVMALLPYGFRHKMTAATWTRPTLQDHRFRLFFSNAPRARAADYVVKWGEPANKIPLPGQVSDYYEWLNDKFSPLAQLAGQRLDFRFDNKSAVKALELADSLQYRAKHRLVVPLSYVAVRRGARQPSGLPAAAASPASIASVATAVSFSPVAPVTAPPPAGAGAPAAPRVQEDPFEEDIASCAQYVQAGNGTRLRAVITRLQKRVEATQIHRDRRSRYQAMIAEYGLFRQYESIAKQEESLYDALLALAFDRPVTYEDYCEVEHCLGIAPGTPPHHSLLEAIERTKMRDPISNAIVLTHLNDQPKLFGWLASGDIDVVGLINLLASNWEHPGHAKLVCDVTLTYLETQVQRYEPDEAKDSLRGHGFLARALQGRHPGNDQYQIHVLYRFLQAAYPHGLRAASVAEILHGTQHHPPTPALLAAVLMLVSTPGDAEFAQQAYIYGILAQLNIDTPTSQRLKSKVPSLHSVPFATPEASPAAVPGTDQA